MQSVSKKTFLQKENIWINVALEKMLNTTSHLAFNSFAPSANPENHWFVDFYPKHFKVNRSKRVFSLINGFLRMFSTHKWYFANLSRKWIEKLKNLFEWCRQRAYQHHKRTLQLRTSKLKRKSVFPAPRHSFEDNFSENWQKLEQNGKSLSWIINTL